MKTINVKANDVGKRIDNFIAKCFSNIPKTLIFKWLRKGTILVNDKQVENNYRLNINDVIKIKEEINHTTATNQWTNIANIKDNLQVVYEDENIVLINKPIGILSQDDNNKEINTIQNIFLKYLIKTKQFNPEQENTFIPSICNRLDRNTSGIIIAAKNSLSLKEMNELIKNQHIDKYYLAMTMNRPKNNHEILVAYHYKNDKENLVYISDVPKQNYKKIITEYWIKKTNGKYVLWEIRLITGKTHQIRAHLNHINCPIVGDTKYKDKNDVVDSRFKTQALISYKLKFNIPNQNQKLAYLNNKTFALDNIWFEKYLK